MADIIQFTSRSEECPTLGYLAAPAGGASDCAARFSLFDRWNHCALDGCGDCGASEREVPFCRDPRCPLKERA